MFLMIVLDLEPVFTGEAKLFLIKFICLSLYQHHQYHFSFIISFVISCISFAARQRGQKPDGKTIKLMCTCESQVSDPKSQLHFFPNPQIFLHIQRELHSVKLPIQQFFWKQHIFRKRDNSLLLEINFRWQNLIQVSVASNKSF